MSAYTPTSDATARPCAVDGCERTARARGWCMMHWKRWWKHGDPLYVRPERRTRYAKVDGYVNVRIVGHPLADSRGMIPEHRLVMWEQRGPFDPALHVHHINGVRTDNRIENLELLTPHEHAVKHHAARRAARQEATNA